MIYHRFRFGWRQNLNVLICRIFGHKLNDDPSNLGCGRCGLAYEECYYPRDYFIESGLIKFSIKDQQEKDEYKKREYEREFNIVTKNDPFIFLRIKMVDTPLFCIDKNDPTTILDIGNLPIPSYGKMIQLSTYRSCVPMPNKNQFLYILKGTYDQGYLLNK